MSETSKKRLEIYTMVENMLRRPITKEEHEQIKQAILEYTEILGKQVAELNQALQKNGALRKQMAQMLYKRGQRAEVLETQLLFLKEMYEKN